MRPVRTALALVLAAASVLPAAVDESTSELERMGIEALDRGRPAEAARVLRSACFGLLDVPERLAGCLVRLAIAEARANDAAGFARSFERLEIVEGRFGAVRAAGGGALGEELGAAIRERISAELVAGSPLRFLVEPPAAAVTVEAGSSGEGAPGAATPAETDPEPSSPPAGLESPAAESAPEPPRPEPAPVAGSIDAEVAAETIARARRLLASPASEPELVAAIAELTPLADSSPSEAALQRLVAVLAYRASRWPLCVERFRAAGGVAGASPLEQFYFAVCLYESGDQGFAAEVLRPVASAIKRNAFVDGYLARILGARP